MPVCYMLVGAAMMIYGVLQQPVASLAAFEQWERGRWFIVSGSGRRNENRLKTKADREVRPTQIGSSDGDCAPSPSHTTGRAVFRIRRLNPAASLRRKIGWHEEAVAAQHRVRQGHMQAACTGNMPSPAR